MQHKVKLTVIDKKLYPELQQKYYADKQAGGCPCYNVGDEFIFSRYGGKDDFWHCGINTMVYGTDDGKEFSAGDFSHPHCAEAWDAFSRYIYTGLNGGDIMSGWMADPKTMITCCQDGTRPVIFKIERLDYKAVYIKDLKDNTAKAQEAVEALKIKNSDVLSADFDGDYMEIYVKEDINDDIIIDALDSFGLKTEKID